MSVTRDLRTSLRSLRRDRAFTWPALGTLALGLGAAAALISIVDSVLLRPLPFPDAERVTGAWFVSPTLPGALDRVRHSEGTYLHWRDRSEAFSSFALAERATMTMDDGIQADRLVAARVTPEIHAVLGRGPALGRALEPGDMEPGAEPVLLLADGLWEERFGRRPDVLGELVVLDGVRRRVVGVLPADVRFPTQDVRAWVPLTIDVASPDPLNFVYTGYGRLAPGQDIASAEADFLRLVDLLPEVLPAAFPRPVLERARFSPLVEPLPHVLLGDTRPALLLLGTASLLLLGIVGANFASLTVVRADARMRDLAILAATGATAPSLRRMLVFECLGLASLGALAGFVLAVPVLDAVAGGAGDLLPRSAEAGLTPLAVLATLGFALSLGVAGGSVASSRLRPSELAGHLRSGAGVGAHRSAARLRGTLVGAQVALASVLVLNAALTVRAFKRLSAVDVGVEVDGTLTAGLALDERGYPDWATARSFLLPLLDDLGAQPGVSAVTLSNHLPLRQGRIFRPFLVETVPATRELPQPQLTRVVTDGYEEALGIAVVEGRSIERSDLLLDAPVAVVGRSLAEAWWPDGRAVGQRIAYGLGEGSSAEPDWLEVVGVLDDVRDRELSDGPPGMVYVPLQARHLSGGRWRELSMAVRSDDPTSTLTRVRGLLAERDRTVPLFDVRTMDRVVRDLTRRDRAVATVLTALAATALVLAAVGLYGLLSYVVGRRRRELGLRLALGADPRHLRSLLVRQAAALVGSGLLVGGLLHATTTALSARTFFQTGADDPFVVAAVLALLVAASAAAVFVPARRVSVLSPAITLKED